MERFLSGLSGWRPQKQPTTPRSYRCRCGRPVFFRNSECVACHTALGFDPARGRVVPVEEGDRRCANFDGPAGCNWLVRDGQPHCIACRLNRTIPDLAIAENGVWWRKIEIAKRRLVSQLVGLGLPVDGLKFDLLRGPGVMTGHANGLITINIEEADDPRREQVRTAMHEPYRTLLGHFRHEVGHYYWDRLIAGTPRLDGFRALFGDEQQDYAAALKRHHEEGPDPTWATRCVSAYASSHPWEDWAETWAHYLHMVDTMDTALSFGIDGDNVELDSEPFTAADLAEPDEPGAARFLQLVNAWVDLTAVLNELSRSMGQHDFYPFVLSRPVIAKLHFVHRVVSGGG